MVKPNYAWLLCAITLMPSSLLAAIDVKGKLNGNVLVWDNATRVNGDLVPNWQSPPSLLPIKTWIPATFSGKQEESFKLRSPEGESESIDIDFRGIQYNSTGINFTQSPSSVNPTCQKSSKNPPIFTVIGESCFSDVQLSSTVPTSPFVFYRPMFTIKPEQIVEALKGKPAGYYSAAIPFTFEYRYFLKGILSPRKISNVLLIGIEHNPAFDIRVSGSGEMKANYDTEAHRISADTEFHVEVKGAFTNGIRLTMPQKQYRLVNSNDSAVSIPYQVVCQNCDVPGQVLVDDEGVLIEPFPTVGKGGSFADSLNFSLQFKYDVDGTKLSSGTYNDAVSVLFEAGI